MKNIATPLLISLLLSSMLQGCLLTSKTVVLEDRFNEANTPVTPDYSKENHWAALPTKRDPADSIPKNEIGLKENQSNAKVDVFFIHPTIFTYEPTGTNQWNGDVNDEELNKKVDYSTILNQATAFNEAGRIYAPRYRQAHIFSYSTDNKEDGVKAFDIAYQDVKAAFEYYLKNYNNGRPIVIAAHSQGTQHGKRLLREFFDGTDLQKQLVAAYLVGMVTPPDFFKNIPPAISATQTGAVINWCTYAKGYFPPTYTAFGLDKSLSVNPLTWDTTSVYAPRELNKGGVGLGFKLSKTALVDTQNHQGMLWIGRPHIQGSAFLKLKNWHRADYNLFWMNIRENVKQRIDAYFTKTENKK